MGKIFLAKREWGGTHHLHQLSSPMKPNVRVMFDKLDREHGLYRSFRSDLPSHHNVKAHTCAQRCPAVHLGETSPPRILHNSAGFRPALQACTQRIWRPGPHSRFPRSEPPLSDFPPRPGLSPPPLAARLRPRPLAGAPRRTGGRLSRGRPLPSSGAPHTPRCPPSPARGARTYGAAPGEGASGSPGPAAALQLPRARAAASPGQPRRAAAGPRSPPRALGSFPAWAAPAALRFSSSPVPCAVGRQPWLVNTIFRARRRCSRERGGFRGGRFVAQRRRRRGRHRQNVHGDKSQKREFQCYPQNKPNAKAHIENTYHTYIHTHI